MAGVLEICSRSGVRVIPWGGGTSVTGGVNVLAGDNPVLTLDLERIAGLTALDQRSGLATFGPGTRGPAVEAALAEVEGVETVEVTVHPLLATVQPGPTHAEEPPPTWADKIPGVKHVIAVASGKGGVGKSTVSANLALAMAVLGHDVGLLDGDIYGPSQQMMMGTTGEPMGDADGRIHPVESPGGVKVMSFGFLVDTDQPVIWRGPMLQKALEQFFGVEYESCCWGVRFVTRRFISRSRSRN